MSATIDAAEYAEMMAKQKISKYKNVKATREIDGTTVTFDSQMEARRYDELALLRSAGAIERLALQYRYDLTVEGDKICSYIADFVYFDVEQGHDVVEDCKGFRTDSYRLKKKLMKAIHEIDIIEVKA